MILSTENRTDFDRIRLFQEKMPDFLATDSIINALIQKKYFVEPASSKYHGSYEGALFDHSMDVIDNLEDFTVKHGLIWMRPESPKVVGALHDLCKMELHKPVYKKLNTENVIDLFTEEKPYIPVIDHYEYNDVDMPDHGARSLAICTMLGIQLTEEEMLCIRWHMGAFEPKENWNYYTRAIHKYPNVLWTHMADMVSAHINDV
jgi:hypothetical protein